jgi:hypothetical protein
MNITKKRFYFKNPLFNRYFAPHVHLPFNFSVCTSLGEFAKLHKATISFVMSVFHPFVRLSIRMEQLGFHWTGFGEI